MRRIWVCACFLILLAPVAALAQQDYPRGEVFGGYSYFRANPEEQNLNGWEGSFTGNVTSWFGVEGDIAGHYGRPKDEFGFTIPGIHINQYTFMGGPKLTLRTGFISPFFHALIGAARAGTHDTFYQTRSSDTALAAALGGGIDIELSKYIAIRPAQLDYVATRFKTDLGDRQNNFRYSAGIVFRF